MSNLVANSAAILAVFCATLSFASHSNSDDTLPPPTQAPTEEIGKLTEACHQIAVEDQVEANELPQFMLDCVNDQLTEMGYQRVKQL